MKSENDIIAEYIKKNFPEILETLDFEMFKLGASISDMVNTFTSSIMNFFVGLNNQQKQELLTTLTDEEAEGDNNG